jgi:hypothetical protein
LAKEERMADLERIEVFEKEAGKQASRQAGKFDCIL